MRKTSRVSIYRAAFFRFRFCCNARLLVGTDSFPTTHYLLVGVTQKITRPLTDQVIGKIHELKSKV
jgi:hypothetical protein